jgi:hypothetical protein
MYSIAHARDEESIGIAGKNGVGELVAPLVIAYNQPNEKSVQQRANELLKFYLLHKNALTHPKVAGICPNIQSKVAYTPFIPISSHQIDVMSLPSSILSELLLSGPMPISDSYVELDNKTYIPVTQIQGIVIERKIQYDAEVGLEVELTISPGLIPEGSEPITDDDIQPYSPIWPTEANPA